MREPLIVQIFPELADDPSWMALAALGVIGGSILLLFLLKFDRKRTAGRR